ncbi:hypothetical protein [Pseudovibrio exalbescens]|uniref:Uncharacterized protein n=1 Tax=Pseudovibrio exalbescens TaxID=197461 RepID=A0A1U7JCN6_9HYPH|nr:hypothetical protein [Pseudovibrio exalbescens]OKL42516.1 hypothetical protein A3843_17780 [Pseudovibrio exalbescens]
MSNPTPIPVISQDNLLFGSIRLTDSGYADRQLPSLYFMSDTNQFVRLRPFHRSGFCIIERPSRFIYIEAAYGQSSNIVYQCELGDTKAGIQATLQNLPVSQVNAKPSAPTGLNLFYITDGPFSGTTWFSAPSTQNNLCSVILRDFTTRSSVHHKGHALISKDAVTKFYNDTYPGMLDKLLALGTKEQSFTYQWASQGDVKIRVRSNQEYFPEASFIDQSTQFDTIKSFINGLSS